MFVIPSSRPIFLLYTLINVPLNCWGKLEGVEIKIMVTRAKILAHPDWRKDLQSGSAGQVTGGRLRARLDAILLGVIPKFYFKTPLIKGLFTWRWGTPSWWGNPLSWGNPHVQVRVDRFVIFWLFNHEFFPKYLYKLWIFTRCHSMRCLHGFLRSDNFTLSFCLGFKGRERNEDESSSFLASCALPRQRRPVQSDLVS